MSINHIPQKEYSFCNNNKVVQLGPVGFKEPVRNLIKIILERFEPLLPKNPYAHILLKPNCNNDLSSLFGNSTDLRILKSVIDALSQRGYHRITLADGSNIGTYRKGVDVFSRLGIRRLAKRYEITLVDLNRAPTVLVDLATDQVAIPEVCFSADFVISLPKIKTHAEAILSFSMKNLIGCVAGLDKSKVHHDLSANIVALNEKIPVHLIIGDGLIVMGGNGPGDGQPFFAGILLAGTDSFRLDGIAARLMGFDPHKIPAWEKALSMRKMPEDELASLLGIRSVFHLLPAPCRGFWARLLDHPCVTTLRAKTRFFHSHHQVRSFLYRLGLIQDVYSQMNSRIERLIFYPDRCDDCQLCESFCPLESPPPTPSYNPLTCLKCLSCYWICPHEMLLQSEANWGILRNIVIGFHRALKN